MTTIETILSRAMSEPEFARQLIADADQALMGYDLTDQELLQIKSIQPSKFNTIAVEERKSLASTGVVRGGGFYEIREQGG